MKKILIIISFFNIFIVSSFAYPVTMCNEYNPKNIGYFYGTGKDTGPSYVYYPAEMWGYYCLNPQFENPETGKCKDLFAEENKAFTCNPNTNKPEYRPEFIFNPDYETNGEPPIGCKDGKVFGTSYYGIGSNSDGSEYIPYSEYTCSDPKEPDNSGDGTENPTFETPTVSVGADGSTTWTWADGTTQTLSTNGTLTTYYPDGTNSVKQVGNDYDPTIGGSSGGTATGGTGGAGTNGNTTNETDTANNNDTPIDDTPASNSCQDSSLTLQEKMLCEMNAGMKKINSESNTENSLNNLLKDLNNTSNTNATAINTNIKETNKKLDSVKSLNENQLAEQKKANATLEKIKDSGNATELNTKVMNESLNKIVGDDSVSTPDLSSLKDSSSWIDSVLNEYTTFYNNLQNSNKSFETFANNATQTINQGFSFNLSSNQLVNCPIDYTIDLSSLKTENININIDFCEQTSKLRPFLYPFILIILFIAIIYLTFSFIRGL